MLRNLQTAPRPQKTPQKWTHIISAATIALLLANITNGQAQITNEQTQNSNVLSTTLNPLDHTSPYYYDTVRDTANIYADLWNNISAFKNGLTGVYRQTVLRRDAPPRTEAEAAFLEDLFRYTDAHGAAELDSAVLVQATKYYESELERVNSVANFDTLYDKYATPEIRTKYRDLILDHISAAKKEILGFQNLSAEARERALQDVQNRFWDMDECIKEKKREKTILALRTEVVAAFEQRREEIIQQRKQILMEKMLHSSVVYSAFSPVIQELGTRTNTLLSTNGPQFEKDFLESWYPWVKEQFPTYVAQTGGVSISEKTRTLQRINPYYNPEHERRVARWKWVDEIGSLSFDRNPDGTRTYDTHPEYKVRVIEGTNAAAVFNGDHLVAVSKGYEGLSLWAVGNAINGAKLAKGDFSTPGDENLTFRLRHHLPITDAPQNAALLEDLNAKHKDTLQGHIYEREDGLTFLHHFQDGKVTLRESYFQDESGNVFRRIEVAHYK